MICPSCKGNSLFKLYDGQYKCNYCQAEFSANTESIRNFAKTVDALPKTEDSGYPTPSEVKKTKLLFALIGLGIILFIAGVATFLFLAV